MREGLWGGCLEDRECRREACGGVALHAGQLRGHDDGGSDAAVTTHPHEEDDI